ncbi:MAG: glucosamine-6-phosphate deaminase [Planctomycetales bacterium]|nr:glucosamine-6-phosphate deaminase [Planctomycetales bacterium]
MNIVVSDTAAEMGKQAAEWGADVIRQAIATRGEATIIVATGASQFTVLENLVKQPGIDWTRVTGFHLDEYIGLPMDHPASFRGYLKQRFVDLVPLSEFHYIDGEFDIPSVECGRLAELLRKKTIDVAFVGIGENGHLAFNDPPADFETESPYIVVQLDEACRRQQWGEGWFPTLDDVPRQAISMSIRQIMKTSHIVCSVPDQRKAEAVANSVEGPVTPQVPASILQEHANTNLFLDAPAASLLKSIPNG